MSQTMNNANDSLSEEDCIDLTEEIDSQNNVIDDYDDDVVLINSTQLVKATPIAKKTITLENEVVKLPDSSNQQGTKKICPASSDKVSKSCFKVGNADISYIGNKTLEAQGQESSQTANTTQLDSSSSQTEVLLLNNYLTKSTEVLQNIELTKRETSCNSSVKKKLNAVSSVRSPVQMWRKIYPKVTENQTRKVKVTENQTRKVKVTENQTRKVKVTENQTGKVKEDDDVILLPSVSKRTIEKLALKAGEIKAAQKTSPIFSNQALTKRNLQNLGVVGKPCQEVKYSRTFGSKKISARSVIESFERQKNASMQESVVQNPVTPGVINTGNAQTVMQSVSPANMTKNSQNHTEQSLTNSEDDDIICLNDEVKQKPKLLHTNKPFRFECSNQSNETEIPTPETETDSVSGDAKQIRVAKIQKKPFVLNKFLNQPQVKHKLQDKTAPQLTSQNLADIVETATAVATISPNNNGNIQSKKGNNYVFVLYPLNGRPGTLEGQVNQALALVPSSSLKPVLQENSVEVQPENTPTKTADLSLASPKTALIRNSAEVDSESIATNESRLVSKPALQRNNVEIQLKCIKANETRLGKEPPKSMENHSEFITAKQRHSNLASSKPALIRNNETSQPKYIRAKKSLDLVPPIPPLQWNNVNDRTKYVTTKDSLRANESEYVTEKDPLLVGDELLQKDVEIEPFAPVMLVDIAKILNNGRKVEPKERCMWPHISSTDTCIKGFKRSEMRKSSCIRELKIIIKKEEVQLSALKKSLKKFLRESITPFATSFVSCADTTDYFLPENVKTEVEETEVVIIEDDEPETLPTISEVISKVNLEVLHLTQRKKQNKNMKKDLPPLSQTEEALKLIRKGLELIQNWSHEAGGSSQITQKGVEESGETEKPKKRRVIEKTAQKSADSLLPVVKKRRGRKKKVEINNDAVEEIPPTTVQKDIDISVPVVKKRRGRKKKVETNDDVEILPAKKGRRRRTEKFQDINDLDDVEKVLPKKRGRRRRVKSLQDIPAEDVGSKFTAEEVQIDEIQEHFDVNDDDLMVVKRVDIISTNGRRRKQIFSP